MYPESVKERVLEAAKELGYTGKRTNKQFALQSMNINVPEDISLITMGDVLDYNGQDRHIPGGKDGGSAPIGSYAEECRGTANL